MSYLVNAFSSALTRPGQNAYNSEAGRQGQVGSQSMDIFSQLSPYIKQYMSVLPQTMGYANSLTPGRESMLNSFIGQGQAAMSGAMDQSYINHAYTNSLNQGMGTFNNMLASNPGMSSSMRQGMLLNANNGAAQAQGNAYQSTYDPAQMMNRKTQILGDLGGAYNMAGTSPAMSTFNQMMQSLGQAGGLVYGQPQVQVQSGLGDTLGQLAGLAIQASGRKPATGGGSQ